ncbi:MAG: isoprenyl transferase [bacterium]|nr:isoprenyl transferase [bacterium]
MAKTTKEIAQEHGLDPENIPQHIAIIMDGNGRWAKKRFLPRNAGHKAGRTALKRTLINCAHLGISHLSVYAFSTENWTRPEEEVGFLMKFLQVAIEEEIDEMVKENIRVRILGSRVELPEVLQSKIQRVEELTEHNTALQLNVMLNYGSRREIIEGINAHMAANPGQPISEETLSNTLYTAGIPDPEILVRTSGEMRISNYLLWQIAYSELFFTETLWPDFNMKDLVAILKSYQNRERRFGGLISA